ncbi:MAG: hypothetical protein PVG20_07540, partial [Thioalkalispiraceae bacterium]
MPKRSQSKLGFDPLSWMDDESEIQQEINTTASKKHSGKEKTMARNSTTKKGSANSGTNDHPLGLNVPALEKSF